MTVSSLAVPAKRRKRNAFKEMVMHGLGSSHSFSAPAHPFLIPSGAPLDIPPPPSSMAGESNKRQEMQLRAAHRRNRRKNRKDGKEEDTSDFVSLRTQLEGLGLTLRDIPGDGNCLFRAFSDQLYGTSDRHAEIRRDVVDFMRSNAQDFEPFLVDEVSFDRHLELLGRDGTFGGNDSIVAFARLHGLTVVIHQINEPLWQVHGDERAQTQRPQSREVHISYHNGDHYNSVRRLGEAVHARTPANISISVLQDCQDMKSSRARTTQDDRTNDHKGPSNYSEDDHELSDYENATKEDAKLLKVMRMSGSDDRVRAQEALEDTAFCVEAAVDRLLQIQTLGINRRPSSPLNGANALWRPGGTANRIFGDESARVATNQTKVATRSHQERLAELKEKQSQANISNRQRQRLKRAEKKLAKEERKKRRNSDEETEGEGRQQPIVANLQALTI